MSQWTDILTAEQLDADYKIIASIDPRMASHSRTFWESRTIAQLQALRAGAWNANLSDQYQMAQSYLALSNPA